MRKSGIRLCVVTLLLVIGGALQAQAGVPVPLPMPPSVTGN